MTFQTHENGVAVAKRMVKNLELIHYAVSLGHHRSLICWIGTEDIEYSTYRHGPEAAKRFREYTGEGVFRLSVGIEDGDDLWTDLVKCF
jgi:cystathionine beta-lyase/cystathionine gamma-synthase